MESVGGGGSVSSSVGGSGGDGEEEEEYTVLSFDEALAAEMTDEATAAVRFAAAETTAAENSSTPLQ